ncbi:MAG: hypothetical protein ABR601_06025 [Parasphingopyxis sp.]
MLVEILKWAASISGMIAALMVASDFGRKVTGWGFVLFTLSSIAWIISGLIDEEGALATQNIVLFGINLIGIYRYLVRKQPAPKGV